MGTRLYPEDNSPEHLEVLAGVPAGTFAKLQELNDRWDQQLEATTTFIERETVFMKRLDELAKPENAKLNILDNFVLYGWGNIDFRLLPDEVDNASGHIPDECFFDFCNAHGIPVELRKRLQDSGGLYYS